jgi:hypothetical protein
LVATSAILKTVSSFFLSIMLLLQLTV